MIGLGKAEKKRDPSVLESLEELDWHRVEESYKVTCLTVSLRLCVVVL